MWKMLMWLLMLVQMLLMWILVLLIRILMLLLVMVMVMRNSWSCGWNYGPPAGSTAIDKPVEVAVRVDVKQPAERLASLRLDFLTVAANLDRLKLVPGVQQMTGLVKLHFLSADPVNAKGTTKRSVAEARRQNPVNSAARFLGRAS